MEKNDLFIAIIRGNTPSCIGMPSASYNLDGRDVAGRKIGLFRATEITSKGITTTDRFFPHLFWAFEKVKGE